MALELSSTNDLSILPFFVGDQPSSHDEEYVEFNAYQKLKTLPETYGLYSCNVTVKDCILGLIISRKSGKKTSQKQDTQISGFLYNPATVTKASLDIFNSLVDEHMEIYADMWTDPATLLPWYHYQVTTHKSPFAQYFMAQSYEKGLYGLRKDAAIAFSLYQVIAEQSIESSGSGTSYTTAVLSMTKLSKVYVKYGLALMYGKGTTVNVEAAIPWLHRAGEMGEGKAALQLGECYLNGMGVRKSETEALKWFSVAAEKGEPAALNNLGACYRYGIGVPNGVPDLAYALELFERAAKVYGFVPAMFNFATSLEAGRGTVDGVPDYEGAAEWYFKAATTLPQPEVRAYTALGKLYLQGYGVAKNQVRAVDCFMKAFRGEGREDGKGDMMAGFYLGMCYMNGEGVDKDYAVAMEWFKRGELQGNPDSVCAIGEMYEQGLGVPVDINTAVSYYKRSIGMGSINGKYNLAMCYFSDHDGQLLAHNQPPPQSTKHYSYLLGNSGEYDHQRRASDTSLSSTTKPKPSGIKKAASFLSFGGGGGKKKESQPVQKVEQVPQHDLYGFSLLSEAAREGHVKACFEMGKCYQNGVRGAQRDRILAIDWYRKARDGGDKRADFVLKNWMN
ncbi:hypothetical protein HK098_004582 [Nowakowskiella sp. JEL0407]|nr:hypothetical protein HK098_004582 [Nowakowskiella sp. JEL0407]